MDSGRQAVSKTKKAPLKDPPSLESLRLPPTNPIIKPTRIKTGTVLRSQTQRGQHLGDSIVRLSTCATVRNPPSIIEQTVPFLPESGYRALPLEGPIGNGDTRSCFVGDVEYRIRFLLYALEHLYKIPCIQHFGQMETVLHIVKESSYQLQFISRRLHKRSQPPRSNSFTAGVHHLHPNEPSQRPMLKPFDDLRSEQRESCPTASPPSCP